MACSDLKMAVTFVGSSANLVRSWYRMKLGMAMAARMPMMGTTIMSSIRVKPFSCFFMVSPRACGSEGVAWSPSDGVPGARGDRLLDFLSLRLSNPGARGPRAQVAVISDVGPAPLDQERQTVRAH